MKRLAAYTLLFIFAMSGTILAAETVPAQRYEVNSDWLTDFYANQTWDWGNGHAYFAPDGTFQAVLTPGQSGEGKWYVKNKGMLCFKGTWKSPAGSGPAKKCWKHQKDQQGRLYQAPLDGWFRSKWVQFDPETQLTTGNVHKSKFEYASGKIPEIPARPLSDEELINLFYSYTWEWDDGHGYFANRGVFNGVSGPDSIGIGRWYPDGKGSLCIKAKWSGADFRPVKKKSCWMHVMQDDGTILQTPSDDLTAWSVFNPKDSLVRGNIHGERFVETKHLLDQ